MRLWQCKCPRRQRGLSSSDSSAPRGCESAKNAHDRKSTLRPRHSPPPRVAVRTYSLLHLSDQTLLQSLAALVAQDRATTAALLAHIAEVDSRRLYLPGGYSSMIAYCVGELRLCEQAAHKRIHAARAARRFPAIFSAVAEGRLHLSAVTLLAPHLTEASAPDLLAAAANKSKSEIEQLLADRFPATEVIPMAETYSAPCPNDGQLSPGKPLILTPRSGARSAGQVEAPPTRSTTKPTAPQRVTLTLSMSQSTHDKLRYTQDLLGHQVPEGDLAAVLDRVLDLAIAQLEKCKFAATDRPRNNRPRSDNPRYVPSHVKRAVWKRGGGQCTFTSKTGDGCTVDRGLEFDHILEVPRGGQATVEGIRLRCRAQNQYGAECTFGAEFMNRKREQARAALAVRATERERALAAKEKAAEVIPWLRALGIRADDARRAAEPCERIPDASLEERVKLALSSFGARRPSIAGASASRPCPGA